MAADRTIVCKNSNNISMTFTERGFSPFLLAKANGIYDMSTTVSVVNNTMMDGATYQGSVMGSKNIVLVLKDIGNFDSNRDLLDVLFSKGDLGTLIVYDGNHERQIRYYVESITSTASYNIRLTTVSLICPDPYFYDTYEHTKYLSNITPLFEFEHEFLEEGEEFSNYNLSKIMRIDNDSAENNLGLDIIITCSASVVNPWITKIEGHETIKVGSENKPFTLNPGEELIISTETGRKNVKVRSGSIETDVNNFLTTQSRFFQLTRGVNHFGYGADESSDYLTIKVSYRYKYKRA